MEATDPERPAVWRRPPPQGQPPPRLPHTPWGHGYHGVHLWCWQRNIDGMRERKTGNRLHECRQLICDKGAKTTRQDKGSERCWRNGMPTGNKANENTDLRPSADISSKWTPVLPVKRKLRTSGKPRRPWVWQDLLHIAPKAQPMTESLPSLKNKTLQLCERQCQKKMRRASHRAAEKMSKTHI